MSGIVVWILSTKIDRIQSWITTEFRLLPTSRPAARAALMVGYPSPSSSSSSGSSSSSSAWASSLTLTVSQWASFMSYFRICPSLMTIICIVFLSFSSLPYVPTLLFFTTARLLSFHYFALFHLDSALLSIEPLSLSLVSLSLSLSLPFSYRIFSLFSVFLHVLICTVLVPSSNYP